MEFHTGGLPWGIYCLPVFIVSYLFSRTSGLSALSFCRFQLIGEPFDFLDDSANIINGI